MTTATITVSLADADAVTHDADYFQHEEGWVTLKTIDGRQVAAYPAARVTGIATTLGPITATEQQAILNGLAVTDNAAHRLVTIKVSEQVLAANGFDTAEAFESRLSQILRLSA